MALNRRLGGMIAAALCGVLAGCSGSVTQNASGGPTGATNVTARSATLNGSAACGNNGNYSGNCYWQWRWGTNSQFQFHSQVFGPAGRTCGTGCTVNINYQVPPSTPLASAPALQPSTQYQYELCGNGDGLYNSSDPYGMYCTNATSFTTTASASGTAYWYEQGGAAPCSAPGNYDCYSLTNPAPGSTGFGSERLDNTGYSGFVPWGDCSQAGCPGGYAGPPRTSGQPQGWASSWGTWCTDYSTGGTSDKNCGDWGNGVWSLATGPGHGDTCFCGVHLLPDFTGTYQTSNDYPWAYGSTSNFVVTSRSNDTTSGGTAYYAGYECFDVVSRVTGGWIEDCQSNWAGNHWPGWGHGVVCNSSTFAAINVQFNGSANPYGTNYGYGFNGDQNVWHTYSYGTTRAQFQNALNAIHNLAGCSNWDTNVDDYYLTQLEFGTEGGNSTTSATDSIQSARAYTSY